MIIYNKIIPLRGFTAVNVCGVIFARKERQPLAPEVERHEAIHTRQMLELLIIGFYLLYLLEWVIRLLGVWSPRRAYRSLSFEQEAYRMQSYPNYLHWRKPFAWLKYITQKNL